MNAVDHVLTKTPNFRLQMCGREKDLPDTCGPQGQPIAFPIAARSRTFRSPDFEPLGGSFVCAQPFARLVGN